MAVAAAWTTHQFSVVLAVVQVAFVVVFALLSTHPPTALPGGSPTSNHQVNYTDFQDIHVVVVVGFGFLVAFLRRYGFGSFGISLLLTAVTIQWALIVRGLLSPEFADKGKFEISVSSLVQADFTAAVVLISFGALIGKLSPVQYLILALIETPASLASEWVVVRKFEVQDVGGAVVVHVFGAVFGIIVSRILFKKQWQQSDDVGSVYHSEVISFVGAAFLWVFWPSFNAVAVVGDARQRAIVNSYVALAASTVTAFLTSQFINKSHHFNIRHIVSASLAGGVALGASANILLAPFHAALVGAVAGLASIAGFQFVTPIINSKFGVHDTRGVLSIHGIPGIIGSLASAIFLTVYPDGAFPAAQKILGTDRGNGSQACYQLLGLVVAIAIAAVTAVITGVVLKLKVWATVSDAEIFSDTNYFDVPEDYEFTTRVVSHIESVQLREPSVVVQPSSPVKDTPAVIASTSEEKEKLVPEGGGETATATEGGEGEAKSS